MAAVINARSMSASGSTIGTKPNLLYKIDGHAARVNDVFLLSKEEGIWTVSDDRSVRLYLKRDNGQFWPSIHHFNPVPPTCIDFNEDSSRLLVGLLNGNVVEFTVSEDLNSLSERRRWQLHAGPVTAVFLALPAEKVFSCAKDKSVIWSCSETGDKMGSFVCENSCMCLLVDLPFVFVGDGGGHVVVLRLNGNQAQLVSRLSAHTKSVTSLAWDSTKQQLFSGSSDHLVIMWDIGGKRGQAYELNNHNAGVTSLAVAPNARRLFSADDSGKLVGPAPHFSAESSLFMIGESRYYVCLFSVCWDMEAERLETPAWQTSDTCQQCEAPFFWNVTAMWQRKVVGSRQHHCRTCGQAVCDACCSERTTFPQMGFELPVRICKNCHVKMRAEPDKFDLTPLAISSELRCGVTAMRMQTSAARLATASHNRTILIWDIHPLF